MKNFFKINLLAMTLITGMWIVYAPSVCADISGVSEDCVKGSKYFYGQEGFPQNYKDALKWLEKGNCGFLIGRIYDEGLGVEKNHEEAVKWWRKASLQGDTNAQRYVENLTGPEKWPSDKPGQFELRKAIWETHSPHPDWKAVKNLIQASADQGDVVGQEFLAAYYAKESEFDKRGGDPDFLKALQLYEKSVVDGIPSAENNMLNLLRSNKNKMNDSEKSQMEKWFQNRAKNGDSNAARYLGFIYEDGTGLARNPELAKYYYGLAGDYRMQVDGSPITVQGLLSDGHFAFGGETTGWEIILNQPVTIGGNVVVRRLEVDNKKLSVDMAGKKFRMTGIFHWVRGIEVEERKIIYPNEIQPVNESGTQ